MLTVEAYGKLEGGKLILHNSERFSKEIKGLPDQEVILTIKKRGKRSLPQNNYYHGVVVEDVRHRMLEMGYRMTHDEMHEWLKKEFNSREIANEHGEVIGKFPESTTDLNKSDFGVYLDKIMEWAAGVLNIYIPPPTSNNAMNF